MDLNKLPRQDMRRHPGRTAGLVALVALLSFAVYGGTLLVGSLRTGLASLEDRLGADIVVAPYSAKTHYDLLNDVLLEGTPSSFYMDKSVVDEVRAIEGVEEATPQYYLATMKAGCCSMPVQIIGYDPETDFVVKPWIARTHEGDLGLMDVVVGCNISGGVGDTIVFYNQTCNIVAKLDETGTEMDNAVYATDATVKELIRAAEGIGYLDHEDPDQVVSTVLVKVADGYDPDVVLGQIKLYVSGVSAVTTRSMTSSVADSVGSLAGILTTVFAFVWVLVAAVLVVAFLVAGRQRTREFAVLRVLGVSRKGLRRLALREALAESVAGSAIGVALAAVVVVGFNGALEEAFGLPFLLPDVPTMLLSALLVFALTVVAGCAASYASAARLAKVDPGQTLRDE